MGLIFEGAYFFNFFFLGGGLIFGQGGHIFGILRYVAIETREIAISRAGIGAGDAGVGVYKFNLPLHYIIGLILAPRMVQARDCIARSSYVIDGCASSPTGLESGCSTNASDDVPRLLQASRRSLPARTMGGD